MEEKRRTVDLIVPVYRPGPEWKRQLYRIARQDYPVRCVIVMHTDVGDWKREYENWYPGMTVRHVRQEDFDHGGTRRQGAALSDADYLLFMTQDAIPCDGKLVSALVKKMESESDIRAVYARQLPRAGCHMAERYTRTFNYPAADCVKRAADLETLGIKTYFCSNVCAMYERQAYEKLGGFEERTIFNEDMIFAARLIGAGYAVGYAAGARVLHSHNYTAMQQFHRNFDLAVSQAEHPEIFAGIRSEGEGVRLVWQTAEYLLQRRRPWLIAPLIWNSGWKYLGYLMGKNYRRLPRRVIAWCTMNSRYWLRRGGDRA